MLEVVQNLGLGFSVALSPPLLLYAFVGCVIGTLVGVLPGVGPVAGISLLLPATFGMDATRAIVMLAGIYYGAMYGGSTTSILMRIPGEAASVMTCIDGYAMARKGRGGAALAIAAVGSYIAGTASVVALMVMAPPLARVALRFGPPEQLALLLLGLLVLAYMSSGSMLKALAMAALGLLLGTVGIDQMTGYMRYAYGVVELGDGLGVVPVAGVAGPGSANNSATSGAFVPMLALGVPSGPIPAVMLAALMVHGVAPGPLLIQNQPALFWGFIASMYVGNVMLLILNLPLVGVFVNLLRVPYPYLYPAILVFSILGVYAVNASVVDVWIMLAMGVLGYVLRELDFETAPIVLGVVLAPLIELSLRQSLAMSDGRYAIFLEHRIAAALLAFGLGLVLLNLYTFARRGLDWRARMALAEKGDSS